MTSRLDDSLARSKKGKGLFADPVLGHRPLTLAPLVHRQARKAAQADEKKAKAAAQEEAKEAEKWQQGAKGKNAKSEDKAAKDAAAKARKAEAAALLAAEEASLPSKPKAAPSKTKKPPVTKSVPSIPSFSTSDPSEPQSFSASGIDDALDMLNLVGSRTDKATIGSQAAKIETHPERRFKAAFEAYKEEQLPILKKEYPGLRLQQYQDRMFDNFKKSPQNPFNQTHMTHNATKADKVAALQAQKEEIARRLADK
ncbi:coiled-coil domain-containing protein 124 [Sporobolomyces koalae]|uniref:coiled-coil domain-containing protein 124 n=1 Tax=Sporobolomyces koalae TaxID=500713 RepID=UPI00317F29A1